jgi:hypothetical protein
MGAVAAAIIIRREKDLVAHFRTAGSMSAASAQTLSALRIEDGMILRRLRKRAVIRESAPGTFYLDEPSWLAIRGIRRRMVTVMLLVVLAFAIAAVIAARAQPAP